MTAPTARPPSQRGLPSPYKIDQAYRRLIRDDPTLARDVHGPHLRMIGLRPPRTSVSRRQPRTLP